MQFCFVFLFFQMWFVFFFPNVIQFFFQVFIYTAGHCRSHLNLTKKDPKSRFVFCECSWCKTTELTPICNHAALRPLFEHAQNLCNRVVVVYYCRGSVSGPEWSGGSGNLYATLQLSHLKQVWPRWPHAQAMTWSLPQHAGSTPSTVIYCNIFSDAVTCIVSHHGSF